VNRSRLHLFLALAASLGLASACGDDSSLAGTPDTSIADTSSDTSVQDSITGDTSFPTDTNVNDTSFDTGPSDTTSDTRDPEGPLNGLKEDPRFLVPGNRAAKSQIAAAGTLVAWVEDVPDGNDTIPALVVWNLVDPTVAPRVYAPPNLANPRSLVLGPGLLVYVDDRYGDPDLFAVDLERGTERAVVTRPGAQEHPALSGNRLAYEDCSSCVTGDAEVGREPARAVVVRALDSGLEERFDGLDADRRPTFGTLDDRPVLAWISGRALALKRLDSVDPELTVDLGASLGAEAEVAAVAVWRDALAFRPNPLIVNPDSMIVNPDSMYPSDVFVAALDGSVTRLTTHAELAQGMDPALRVPGLSGAADAALTWLESTPGDPALGRLRVWRSAASTVVELRGLDAFAVGTSLLAFTAPRADNDGASDVHVLLGELP
jgi:hypothetical protein